MAKKQTKARDRGKAYLLERIPEQLWVAAQQRMKEDGRSMRWLLLHLLGQYVTRARPRKK